MASPVPLDSYNAHYLKGTRRPNIETPIPRAGKMRPPHPFDVLGIAAAKVSQIGLSDPNLFNRGPFDNMGRMSFESTVTAPVPTSTEYKFLPFKTEPKEPMAEKDDTPPSSIFSNMPPLELVERLIKGVTEPEKKEGFEAVRKYLMRIELIKAQRPLTLAEQAEYGLVVNGLRANALDAFGDGTTQFASFMAYEMGIKIGIKGDPPPLPEAPGLPSVPPAPEPPKVSKIKKLPSDTQVDSMSVDAMFSLIGTLMAPGDEADINYMSDQWEKLTHQATKMKDKTGSITPQMRARLDEAVATLQKTTKGIIVEYNARVLASGPPPPPLSPIRLKRTLSGSLYIPPGSPALEEKKGVTGTSKPELKVEKKVVKPFTPLERVEMAEMLLKQDPAYVKTKQMDYATLVIKAKGETASSIEVNKAFDSIRKKITIMIQNGDWVGSLPEALGHLDPTPSKHPSSMPGSSGITGSGLHTGGSMYGSGQATPSIHGHSKPMSFGWSPSNWSV